MRFSSDVGLAATAAGYITGAGRQDAREASTVEQSPSCNRYSSITTMSPSRSSLLVFLVTLTAIAEAIPPFTSEVYIPGPERIDCPPTEENQLDAYWAHDDSWIEPGCTLARCEQGKVVRIPYNPYKFGEESCPSMTSLRLYGEKLGCKVVPADAEVTDYPACCEKKVVCH